MNDSKAKEKQSKASKCPDTTRASKSSDKRAVFDLRALLKNEKAIKAIVLGSAGLILLYFISSSFSGGNASRKTESDTVEHLTMSELEEQRLEQKLERAISAIDGVGELTIVVTLESLSETVYAERGSGVRTVIAPKVRGVAIVAEGASNPVVEQRIVELTGRLLGINTTRINVTY
ncbi:MAG: hypothetical protein FWG45_02545 [Oscillospiraceae bacterium]|nr:hypothetical protein [Oscillospiraceae bacterium]